MTRSEPISRSTEPKQRIPPAVRHAQPRQLALPFCWQPLVRPSPGGGVPKIPPRAVGLDPPGRCSERGCVFPATDGEGRCLQHQRQWREPIFYSSHQPSSALLEQGKFGPVRTEQVGGAGTGRTGDRRRLAAERQSFLGEQH
jgi:hypothetical protein